MMLPYTNYTSAYPTATPTDNAYSMFAPSTTLPLSLSEPYPLTQPTESKHFPSHPCLTEEGATKLYPSKIPFTHVGLQSSASPGSSTFSDMSCASAPTAYPSDTLLTQAFVPSPTEPVVSFDLLAIPPVPVAAAAAAYPQGQLLTHPPSFDICFPPAQQSLGSLSLSSPSLAPLSSSTSSSTSSSPSLCSTPSSSSSSLSSSSRSRAKAIKKMTAAQQSNSTNTNEQKKVQKPKPYACQLCRRPFARKHDLQRHIRVHTGDKPYACLCCKKVFARTDALKRHLRVEEECRESHESQLRHMQHRQQYHHQQQLRQQQQQHQFFFQSNNSYYSYPL